MLVRFRVNLGSVDAGELKLDYRKCQLGMELDVPDDAGNWLIDKGITEAVQVIHAVPPSPEIKAVPGSVEKATADLEEYRMRGKKKTDGE